MDPKEQPKTNPDPESPKKIEEPPPALSHEEQMAQFEEALKESDWGHQPC